ncbi:MAG: ankyrin repeat domain-containing protein, partial [Proteobacteria bacterium]|nr:ankyrin repeat domain-containing protein [Pseudomonadota bacterium]
LLLRYQFNDMMPDKHGFLVYTLADLHGNLTIANQWLNRIRNYLFQLMRDTENLEGSRKKIEKTLGYLSQHKPSNLLLVSEILDGYEGPDKKNTLALVAAVLNRADVLGLLFVAGADLTKVIATKVSDTATSIQTSFTAAIQNGSTDCVEFLLGIQPGLAQQSILNIHSLRYKLYPLLLDSKVSEGASVAEKSKRIRIFQMLLSYGAHPDKGYIDEDDQSKSVTPLMKVVKNGEIEFLDTLIEYGVDLNQTYGSEKETIVEFARSHSQNAIAEKLEKIIKNQDKEKNIRIALFNAITHGKYHVVENIIKRYQIKYTEGFHTKTLKDFLNEPFQHNWALQSFVCVAVLNNRHRILQLLYNNGVSIHDSYTMGEDHTYSLIWLAASHGFTDMVVYLLNTAIIDDSSAGNSVTPLEAAVRAGHLETSAEICRHLNRDLVSHETDGMALVLYQLVIQILASMPKGLKTESPEYQMYLIVMDTVLNPLLVHLRQTHTQQEIKVCQELFEILVQSIPKTVANVGFLRRTSQPTGLYALLSQFTIENPDIREGIFSPR